MKYILSLLFLPFFATAETTIKPLTQTNITEAITDKAKFASGNSLAPSSALSGKQDTLISATNIKTINGNNLLGSGDITISSAPTNASVNSAIATDPAASRLSLGLDDPASIASTWNGQPYVAKRVYDYGNGGSTAPIRIFVYGDSYATGFVLPSNAARRGEMNLNAINISGSIAVNSADTNTWVNGVTTTHAAGSQCDFTRGGVTTAGGNVQGDLACIAYIKGPSYGTFKFQYESGVSVGTWVDLATIDASNATTVGAYAEYPLPSNASNASYRLRITNVTGGGVKRIFCGIMPNTGGGAALMNLGNLTGMSPSSNVVSDAILTPIWQGLKPDLVLSCFLESDATQWDVGGAFNNFYLQTKAAKSSTDWIMVGPNPSVDESAYPALLTAEKAWALRNKESFFNQYGFFRSYAFATANGMMADTLHLSGAGHMLRNYALWKDQMLGNYPLGQTGMFADGYPMWTTSKFAGDLIGGQRNVSSRPVQITGADLVITDPAILNDDRAAAKLSYTANSMTVKVQNSAVLDVNFRYFKPLAGVAYLKNNCTATDSLWYWHYGATCDATAGSFTLNLGHSSASLDGRVHTITKTDSSGNTVTIDPLGGETINGVSTLVLRKQGDTVTLQSHSGNWIILGGNVYASSIRVSIPDTLTAPGAVSKTTETTMLTTTAPGQAITLTNGTHGQIKTIVHVASSNGGTAILTPTTALGFSTVTFTNFGDTVTIQYFFGYGWMIIESRGAVAS